MLLTITLIITSLVAINFLLLKFSVNKVHKSKEDKTIVVLNPDLNSPSETKILAPTGS